MLYVYSTDQLCLSSYSKEFIKPLLQNVQYAILPFKKKYYTVLRSPHVDKKAREQFIFGTVKAICSLRSDKTLPAGVSGVCNKKLYVVYNDEIFKPAKLCRIYKIFW